MATSQDVLKMLCAGKEYTIYGDDFDGINWYGEKPAITKAQFEAGFAQYDAWKTEQDAVQAAAKAALLERLGITEAEAKLLLA